MPGTMVVMFLGWPGMGMGRVGIGCRDRRCASCSLVLRKVEGAWLYGGSFPGLDEAWDKKEA